MAAAPAVAFQPEALQEQLEEMAPVEEVHQLPRGARYRRIRKEHLLAFIADIVRRFSGQESQKALVQLTEKDLHIQKLESVLNEKDGRINELEAQLSGLSSRADSAGEALAEKERELEELRRKLEELERKSKDLGGIAELWHEKEEEYLHQIREKEDQIQALEQAVRAEDLRGQIRDLEEQVIVLKGKINELQRGFEYVGFVEEFDVGSGLLSAAELRTRLEELTSGVGEATALPAQVRGKLEYIIKKTADIERDLQRSRKAYSELIEKMESCDGSISVVVDTASAAQRIRGLTEQLGICRQILELVESFLT